MDSNLRPVTLQCALAIIPALVSQRSAFAGMMKTQIEEQVRDWYSQGVRLQVDISMPLGKQLVKQGWIKE